MGQNRSAYDGQIGVGAHEVVGELAHKVQQLAKAGPVDFHGCVNLVETDAVLVIVHIGRVLQKPGRAVDGNGDNPVVLPGGVVHPAGIPLVLRAQQTPGIGGGGQIPGRRNGLGVLLRLGQVDGDVQFAILGGSLPLHIFGNPVPADIVGILAEGIVPIGGLLRSLPVQGLEFLNHLGGPGGKRPHQLGIQQIPIGDGVLGQHPPLRRVVQQGIQYLRQLPLLCGGERLGHGAAVQLQGLQQNIDPPNRLRRLEQRLIQGIGHQLGNG